jgi:hypothetical protein
MAPHKTVTINGRKYDAVTGLPLESVQVTTPDKKPIKKPTPPPAKKPLPQTSKGKTNAEGVHSNVQRSQTLLRRATKKPTAPHKPITKRAAPGRHMDIARSAGVSRFAQHPVVEPVAPVAKSVTPTAKPTPATRTDKPARPHPMAQRAAAKTQAKRTVAAAQPTTAKEVKDTAISQALAAPKAKPAAKKRTADKSNFRLFLIIGSILLVLIIALYAVWRMVPNISVSMAATQAGIEASYPEYTPDGYSLSQPVTYSEGEVDLKFNSNSNENYYTIKQVRSSWDSSAVLDNVVTPATGENYVTTKERGLTIYTYETNAAWVNGGILYTIDSKAPLSGDQIRRIATSL